MLSRKRKRLNVPAPVIPRGVWAPVLPKKAGIRPWEGVKPWETAKAEVVIPTIGRPDTLFLAVELLQLQTIPLHIVVIDTGSNVEDKAQVDLLRQRGVEVHHLHAVGWTHASAPVAVALDLALSLCRTEYQILTHADCFVRSRDAAERLISCVNSEEPAAGYQISPREGLSDWKSMIGHTWSALHVPTVLQLGVRWSHNAFLAAGGEGKFDTEYGFCRQLRRAGVYPKLLGVEENYTRNKNEDFDHIRSLISARLYSSAHEEKAQEWLADCVKEAKERIHEWKKQS